MAPKETVRNQKDLKDKNSKRISKDGKGKASDAGGDTDAGVNEVLEDIAQFMILTYNHYLDGLDGSDMLGGLLAFLSDMGFLNNRSLSLLEAENLRVKNLGNMENFEYEQFYGWLRDVAGLVYKDDNEGGRKAMHRLLTTDMIPIASRNAHLDIKRARTYLEFIDTQQLEVLCLCEDFVRLWYCSAVGAGSGRGMGNEVVEEGLCVWDAGRCWTAVREGDRSMPVTTCIQQLTDICLCPQVVKPEQVTTFVKFLGMLSLTTAKAHDPSSSADAQGAIERGLSFTDFLVSLMFVAKIGHKRLIASRRAADTSIRGAVSLVLQKAAEHMLSRSLEGAINFQTTQLSRLVWLCRQAGLLSGRRCGSDRAIIDRAAAALEDIHVNSEKARGPAEELLRALVQVLEKETGVPLAGLNRVLITSAHERTEPAVMALYLALSSPPVLLSDGAPPSPLRPMYCSKGLSMLSQPDVIAILESSWRATAGVNVKEWPETVRRWQVEFHFEELRLITRDGGGNSTGSAAAAAAAALNAALDDVQGICADECVGDSGLNFSMWQEAIFCFVAYLRERSSGALSRGGGSSGKQDTSVEQTLRAVRAVLDVFDSKAKDGITSVCNELWPTDRGTENSLSSTVTAVPPPAADNAKMVAAAAASSSEERCTGVERESDHMLKSDMPVLEGSIRDTLILLMHFPLSSRRFTPWAMVALYIEVLRKGEDQNTLRDGVAGGGSPAPAQVMSQILRSFTKRLGLRAEAVSAFFSDLTWEGSQYTSRSAAEVLHRKQRVQTFLSAPFFAYLVDPAVLSFMHANEELLLWEFMACSRLNRLVNPFTVNAVVPVPCCTSRLDIPNGLRLTAQAITAWAVRGAGLDQEMAAAAARHIQAVFPGDFTFSSFVVFAVYIFTAELFRELKPGGRPSAHEFLARVKSMMQRFSDDISAIQHSLQIRIMRIFCGEGGRRAPSSGATIRALSALETDKLLENAVRLFDGERDAFVPVERGGLPPRPPSALWDAPRFVEFVRFFGLFGSARKGLAETWRSFAAASSKGRNNNNKKKKMKTTSDHGRGVVVSPTPQRFTLDLVKCLMEALLGDASLPLTELCSTVVLPVAASVLHTTITSPTLTRMGDRGGHVAAHIAMEDIARFGGHRLFLALESHSALLVGLFHSAKDGSRNLPSMTRACQAVCIKDALSLGVVCVLAKQSLHHTHRSSFADVSIAPVEFEELVLRCALHLWLSPGDRTRSLALPAAGAGAGAGAGGAPTWGTDFLTPYFALLRTHAPPRLLESLAEQVPPPSSKGGGSSLGTKTDPRAAPTSSLASPSRRAGGGGSSEGRVSEPTSPEAGMTHSSSSSPTLMHSVVALEGTGRTSPTSFVLGELPLPRTTSLESVEDMSVREEFGEDEMFNPVVKSLLEIDQILERSDYSASLTRSPRKAPGVVGGGDGEWTPPSSSDRVGVSGGGSDSADAVAEVAAAAATMAASMPGSGPEMNPFNGLKELLWPVHATFCSCGDSLNPGKISGPNLFTLLCKLGVLSDSTMLSDVGLLLHQVSVRSPTVTSGLIAGGAAGLGLGLGSQGGAGVPPHSVAQDLPSLSYEDLLVFLCAFAQLVYEGEVSVPMSGELGAVPVGMWASEKGEGSDFDWAHYINSCGSFRRLLEEHVRPVLTRIPLLAMPDDARKRDRHNILFSLEMIFALQTVESRMRRIFERVRTRSSSPSAGVAKAPNSATASSSSAAPSPHTPPTSSQSQAASSSDFDFGHIFGVLVEAGVTELGDEALLSIVEDISYKSTNAASLQNRSHRNELLRRDVTFPQFEWVLCVCSLDATSTKSENYDSIKVAASRTVDIADLILSHLDLMLRRSPPTVPGSGGVVA